MGIYVRKELRTNDRVYYWFVTSYRRNGKVHQKKLLYFGTKKPTLEEIEKTKKALSFKIDNTNKY
jgi:hypothetical protein